MKMGGDVIHCLLDIEGASAVVGAYVEVFIMLERCVDWSTVRVHVSAADVMAIHRFESHGEIRHRRLADGLIEEVREPILKGVSRVAVPFSCDLVVVFQSDQLMSGTLSFNLSREAARIATFDCIEGFCNRVRRHPSLDCFSPAEYEEATMEATKEVAVA